MKKFKWMFLLVVFLFSFVSAAWGAPVCVPGTLADYFVPGFSCSIGDTLFSDFANLEIPGSATPIAPSGVMVNPLNDLNGPGFEFVVNKTAQAGEFFDVSIGYLVSNNTFSGVTLSMAGSSATGNGAVTTIEDIFYAGNLSATLILFAIEGDEFTFDQLTFAPVTSIGVIKDIGIDGGPGGTGQLVSATNQFTVEAPTAIPEPATILLVAAGLGYLGIRRRRFRLH